MKSKEIIHINEAILRTFENNSQEDATKDIIHFYPLRTQKQTREFVKGIRQKGVELEQLCNELGVNICDFELWLSKHQNLWIGLNLMKKVNSCIETVFDCTTEKLTSQVQNPNFEKNRNVMFLHIKPRNTQVSMKKKYDVEPVKSTVSNPQFITYSNLSSNSYEAKMQINNTVETIKTNHESSSPLNEIVNANNFRLKNSIIKPAKDCVKIAELIDKFNQYNEHYEPKFDKNARQSLSLKSSVSTSHVMRHSFHIMNSREKVNSVKPLASLTSGTSNNKYFVLKQLGESSGFNVTNPDKYNSSTVFCRQISSDIPSKLISIPYYTKQTPSEPLHHHDSVQRNITKKFKDKNSSQGSLTHSKITAFNQFIAMQSDLASDKYLSRKQAQTKDFPKTRIETSRVNVANIISMFNGLQERSCIKT